MANYIRLYLVPGVDGTQQVVDVPDNVTLLSNGNFMLAQNAPTLTVVGAPVTSNFTPFDPAQLQTTLTTQETQEIRICWREPSPTQTYPDTGVIEAQDPTDGVCLCGITCIGPQLSYVQVTNV